MVKIGYENLSFYPWGFSVLDKWLQIKNSGGSLNKYFEDNLIFCVAIYGLGTIGKRLYEELHQGRIKVCYGIDQNAESIRFNELKIKTLEDELIKVDAVIITPIDFYSIEKNVRKKIGDEVDIVFIGDIVDYCLNLL